MEMELPEGWVYESTGTLFETQTGNTPSKKDPTFYGKGIPFAKPPELNAIPFSKTEDSLTNSGASVARVLPSNSVLVSCIGNIGKVGINTIPMAFNQQINAIFPSAEIADPRFIFFQTQSDTYRKRLQALSSATTISIVNRKKFDSVPLLIPPLNEQRRIVEKIEQLFGSLDKAEQALRDTQKLLASYRQAILKAAVTGELTADWRAQREGRLEHGRDLLARILKTRRQQWQGRGKYQEPQAPKTDDLPELPDGWVWVTLPMLGEYGRGKSKHRPRNDEKLYDNGKYPFLQTGRIRASRGRISKYDRMYNEKGLAQSKLWPVGTICITIAANIAETGILDIDACFPDSVVGLVPDADVSGDFIENFIRTAKEDLTRYAPATAQKNINLEILSGVAIPLPPSEEQREIVSKVSDALELSDIIELHCQTELQRSAALRQSILKDAFSGQLVEQDPSDEPASALLARIARERAASQPKKTTRRPVKL